MAKKQADQLIEKLRGDVWLDVEWELPQKVVEQ